MLEYPTKPHRMTDCEHTTAAALKYHPTLHLPISTNKDFLKTSLNKRGISQHSPSNGGMLPTNRPTVMDGSYSPEVQPMTLICSTSECAPPALTFPLSRQTSISMNLCGQVLTYDLESLGLNPQVIIELLKATKSECATWMIVSAFYRRRGDPRSGISVMKSFIEGKTIFTYMLRISVLTGHRDDSNTRRLKRAQTGIPLAFWMRDRFGQACENEERT